MAGEYIVTPYTGTMRASLGSAVQDLSNRMAATGSGKVFHVKGISEIGPGRYWQAYAVYDS